MNSLSDTEKHFITHFMLSMVGFLVLIAVQTFAIELWSLSNWLIVVFTLAPIIPLIWAFVIYRKRYLALDEYMQRLTGEAFLWTIGIISFATFAYGMLAMKLPMPEVSMAYILPTVFGGHGLILHFILMADGHEK